MTKLLVVGPGEDHFQIAQALDVAVDALNIKHISLTRLAPGELEHHQSDWWSEGFWDRCEQEIPTVGALESK